MSVVIPSLRGAIAVPGWAKNELWRKARAVPSLDLRFADNKSLTDAVTGASLVTFTRASNGTYTDSAGVLQTAATDVPRFDHDPTTGESLGLLVEEQRTNLLLHNRTLTDAAWTATNVTAAKDQVGIDGVSNGASSITATDANGTILQAVTSASSARATSAYVKRITGTGTIEMTQNGGTTWTAVTVTSNYTRVTIASATVTNPSVGFRIVTNGDAIAVDYVQLENGAFSTSAILTTTAAATRNADLPSIGSSAFASFYNQSENTTFIDTTSVGSNIGFTFVISDGTDNNRNGQFKNGTDVVSRLVLAGAQNNAGSISYTPPQLRVRSLVSAQAGSTIMCVNGALGSASTQSPLPTVDRITIGSGALGTNFLGGTIRRLCFWPQRLANSTLQQLTQ